MADISPGAFAPCVKARRPALRSPPLGTRKRKRPARPLSSESEVESETALESEVESETASDSTESGDQEEAPRIGGRRAPRRLGGRFFLDMSAESTTGTETDASVSDDPDDTSDWSCDDIPPRPKRARVNLRLTSSPDRRDGVIFPKMGRVRSTRETQPRAPTPSAPSPNAMLRRSVRQAQRRSSARWTPDLGYMRQCINQLFRVLRVARDPHGSANRLRHLIRDCYLMGYCRARLAPRTWCRLLQVSGGTWGMHLRNTIREVEARFDATAEPVCKLPCLEARRYGPECDLSNLEIHLSATSDDEISDATDLEAAGSDHTLASQSDTEDAPSPVTLETPEPRGSLAVRLEDEFGEFDWTPQEGSQPWLSAVVADTSSVERPGPSDSGAGRAAEDRKCLDGCRKMRFSTACPYPCSDTFLRP
ncbi:US1 [Human alphaherpesvirus 1]|uniref:ICP22 n=1 Tax=Human herpesvirus 1 TaxID=10298 RepID=F5CCK2_HHV1|nr:regulatory protein ICP22 [Human alphaherpesvirus 1]AED02593.1 ICP22 [Human alphaherpesvirus 1]AER38065.1 regulatory protein ICP22 [Human alphaherpesvirus 1]AKG59241.1 regulatory protein ICP22 [Human alphaherpesvirus 1]AKG59313.1 regulatory protein ICP22 [Human alphaherpesvirus 1]